MKTITPKKIEAMIFTIRKQKIMLDSDFLPNDSELTELRSQIVTLHQITR